MTHSPFIVLATLVALSCSKDSSKARESSSAADAPAADAPAAEAPAPSSLGPATFSATVDGSPVTGSGVDELQQHNAAYILPVARTSPQHLVFYLFSTKNGADESANISLRISTPPKAGTYAKRGGTEHSCECDITLNENIATGTLARYWADSVTITVTSMTPTRVSGTFSGSFVLSSDTPRAPNKHAKVVDGKFDLPMATSRITPE